MKSVGDQVQLAKQLVDVVACEKCGAKMVNLDQKELAQGDLAILKREDLRISNPATKDPVCIACEIKREEEEHTFKRKVNDFFSSPSHDDDSSFFGGGGGSFGGGFGGFGGGSFSGGGASGSY